MQMFKQAAYTGLFLGLSAPTPALAAGKDLNWLITQIFLPILRNVVILIFALALFWFVWDIAQYISGKKKYEDFAENAGWAILAMFVMVSVWGLVKLLQATFPLDNSQPALPNFR